MGLVHLRTLVEDPAGIFANLHERFDPLTFPNGDWTAVSANKRLDFYPMMFQLRGGDVFYAGNSLLLNPTDSLSSVLDLPGGTWGNSAASSPIGGSGVLLTPAGATIDKVMKCGGISSDEIPGGFRLANGRTGVASIDSSTNATTWTSTGLDMPQGERRRWHNLTILPDGKVLMTGGMDDTPPPPNPPIARTNPRLWNPATNSWGPSLALEPATERRYHSSALLLPDGRVLSASGLFSAAPPLQATIFKPPYLQGDPALRPVITSVSDPVGYCDNFTVDVNNANVIDTVCLIRPGAVTHGFNMDQRYVTLKFSVTSGTRLSAQMPANANLVPPGNYLLFVLRDGVPSVAKWVRILRDTVPPDTVQDFAGDEISQHTASFTWTAPGDEGNCGRATAYSLRYATVPITEQNFESAATAATSPPQAPGGFEGATVTSLLCCTQYWFALKTRDEVGNWSAMSPVINARTLCGCGGGLSAQAASGNETRAEAGLRAGREAGRTAHRAVSTEPATLESQVVGRRGLVFKRGPGAAVTWTVRAAGPEEIATAGGFGERSELTASRVAPQRSAR